jgi:hypothetical protein
MTRPRTTIAALAILTGLSVAALCQAEPIGEPSSPEMGLFAMEIADLRHPTFSFDQIEIAPTWDLRPTNGRSVSLKRAVLWGGITAGAGYYAFEQSQASWGGSTGKFHFKDDLHDGLALTDEASHLFTSYQLTRALYTGYSWTGLSSTAARRLAAAHAWLWAFSVEYPVDAYNPTQGFGVSDLVANTLGVLAAYQHTKPSPDWWDIKISVKNSFFADGSRLVANTNEQYDAFIYWLTVRPSRSRYVPVWLGAGYSTTHHEWPRIDKELHLGIGTTVGDMVGLISPSAARYLRPANALFLNLSTKIAWR